MPFAPGRSHKDGQSSDSPHRYDNVLILERLPVLRREDTAYRIATANVILSSIAFALADTVSVDYYTILFVNGLRLDQS